MSEPRSSVATDRRSRATRRSGRRGDPARRARMSVRVVDRRRPLDGAGRTSGPAVVGGRLRGGRRRPAPDRAALRETVTLSARCSRAWTSACPTSTASRSTRRVTKSGADVNILMLTMFDDDDSVLAAMRAGALGYVLKGAERRRDHAGHRSRRRRRGHLRPGPGPRRAPKLITAKPAEPAFGELTPREREILELIAAGLGNPVIATRLGLSPTRSATTSPASSPSSRSRAEARPSSAPAPPDSAELR